MLDANNNTDLIQILENNPTLTSTEFYNLVIADFWTFLTEEQVSQPGSQRLIAYFMYKITETLYPIVSDLNKKLAATAKK